MTQVWNSIGNMVGVTAVSAGPMTVTAVKTKEKDGYEAVQFGFGSKRESLLTKAEKGHLKGLGNFRYLKELRVSESPLKAGDVVSADTFKEGDVISVAAISKGRGFQGVVKRHGFHGGSRTHGQKHSEREPGAIGGRGRAGGRVSKGMRMAGRMGSERVTLKNLRIVQVVPEKNLILVSGAIPGRRGTLVEIHGT